MQKRLVSEGHFASAAHAKEFESRVSHNALISLGAPRVSNVLACCDPSCSIHQKASLIVSAEAVHCDQTLWVDSCCAY